MMVPFAACAATLTGTVYVDRNGDHQRQANEPGVASAVVSVDGQVFAVTDPNGDYRLEPPLAGGIVWVRVPDGFRPGPVWRTIDVGALDLGVIPLTADQANAPLTFVVAADSHTTANPADPWDGGDLSEAIAQAIGLPEPPRFFTIVGDITQANRPAEFDRVEDALDGVTVPWVPVPGNHDWYDGGTEWRARWGPDNYSFDVGYLHVIVWDANLSEDRQVAFITADLAYADPSMTVIGLGHGSPTDAVADQLAAAGVDYLFTGHWHSNRRVEREGLIEWGTQTFIMGSIDQSPSGYRIVTFDDGQPTVIHRERLVSPQLAMTSPHPGSCASPDGFDLMLAAALDANPPEVTARIDCGAPVDLVPIGGWTFTTPVSALHPGVHSVTASALSPSGRSLTRQFTFNVCTPTDQLPRPGDWAQLGGGAEHAGHAPAPLAPPLTQQWATSVGGTVALGSPVVHGGVVMISVTDFGAGDEGGLVALNLATGAVQWSYATAYPVRNAPAIADDTVVVALSNGEVHAVRLADGVRRWSYDLADGLPTFESSLWAAPTIADGAVLIAVQGRMAEIDLASGAARWTQDLSQAYPWLGTLAAVAVSDGTALATTNRDDGLTAWSVTTGAKLWDNRSHYTVAINATPVIADGVVYIANAAGIVTAIEIATATVLWSNSFTAGGFDWGYTVTSAPAIADGRLFLPTQWNDLVAIDAATGIELWRATTPPGPLNFAHYRSAQAGFVASPVVTGDLVWTPRPDGTLVALATDDGRELWSTNLGAPIVSTPAPAGDYLVVATYDGTVRALAPGAAVSAPAARPCGQWPPTTPPTTPPVSTESGGCSVLRDDRSTVLLLAAVIATRWRRRRARLQTGKA